MNSQWTYTIDGTQQTICIQGYDGFEVVLSPMGAGIRRIRIPMAEGLRDVVLPLKEAAAYENNSLYAGATLAPSAGRIGEGRLLLPSSGTVRTDDGRQLCQLSRNENNRHNLHGGFHNASFQLWQTDFVEQKQLQGDDVIEICFSLTLPDGLDGFPGNRQLQACYTIGPGHRLSVSYKGTSDRTTYLNMSNHAYFNLAAKTGPHWPDTADHLLQVQAQKVIYTDETFIPTDTADTAGTAFDFRTPTAPRQRMAEHADAQQLLQSRGYNHAFILDTAAPDQEPYLSCTSPEKDLTLRIYTDAPCCVFYSGGYMDRETELADGRKTQPGCAYAFEMQDWPDAPGGHGYPYTVGTGFERWISWEFSSVRPASLHSTAERERFFLRCAFC